MDREDVRFRDRVDAGRRLAALLGKYKNQNAVIYALPRGGVPVAMEVARVLNCPLDLIIVRKIGHPMNPEYALGAVAEDGFLVVNEEELARVDPKWFEAEMEKQKQEAKRRRELYLQGREPITASGKIAAASYASVGGKPITFAAGTATYSACPPSRSKPIRCIDVQR